MFEFLVEAYHPSALIGAPTPGDIASAAEQLTDEGREVSLVRVVLVPEDETCFYLFEAASFEAVLESTARSGLSFERVVPALSSWVGPAGHGLPSVQPQPAATANPTNKEKHQP